MKIIVIGGTGLIGSKLVALLQARGHEALAASPQSGVNTLTGEGLADALAGAQVVIDVANSPSFEDAAVLAFFETSGRNLLAAERAAGIGHHVALSVVGTAAMFLVGGGILVHGIPALGHGIEAFAATLGWLGSVVSSLTGAAAGLLAGGLVLVVVNLIKRLRGGGAQPA